MLFVAVAVLLLGVLPPAGAGAVVGNDEAAAPPVYAPGEVAVTERSGAVRLHRVRDGHSVQETIDALERTPGVARAAPNPIARISLVPNDPGRSGVAGGWQQVQWNFLPEAGVNAPQAWDNLLAAGRAGARGVVVAVLDTGVAYRRKGRFRRSPDLAKARFVRGHDFVGRDRFPLDLNGHGTHVASTIAETADNSIGVVGLAYKAKIMPVRVLDSQGYGDAVTIAKGIRYAARRKAAVINLSFEFPTSVGRRQIPGILRAVRFARRRGSLVVASSGNESVRAIAYPARAGGIMAVGATTEHACLAEYSNSGAGLDLVAPGGGMDAAIREEPNCRPGERLRDIVQMTFTRSVRRFGLPNDYQGTSMAAPHVSATAAMVIASRVLGRRPAPARLKAHLEATARDLGPPGPDGRYGAGLVDAARATTPLAP